jgi:uncharacterized protein (DUF433 family)
MPLVIAQEDLDRLPITIDPEIVSGTPVFRGTRVPALQVLEFSKTTLLKLRKTA